MLKVDSAKGIGALEKVLKDGKITIVLIYADWCGHCHKFMENVWEPSCQKEAIHNRAAVREDVLPQTSLKGANFDGYPSVIVVNEKGEIEEFNKDGKTTNAIPQPKSEAELTQIANAEVEPIPVTQTLEETNVPVVKEDNLMPNGVERSKTFIPAGMKQVGGRKARSRKGMAFPHGKRRGLAFAPRKTRKNRKSKKTRKH